MPAFKLDGITYKVGLKSVRRKLVVEEGTLSGETQSYLYRADIKGTYYTYSLTFDMRLVSPEDYDSLVESLSAPVASHALTVPYGQKMITFQARVTDFPQDELKGFYNVRRWGDMTVSFRSIRPERV